MKEIKRKVKETIKKYNLINPGDLVIAGVSGGPDSLAMLHLLKGLQAELNFQVHVAHVDHCFRGKEAEEEARWVAELAKEWDIPCTVFKENVPQLAKIKKLSEEEAGRLVRRKLFLELLEKIGAQKIALGHQADDQAETVLMHFLLGTGMEGLQGIKPYNPPFIRPLLFLRREEIEKYCEQQGLKPRFDPSNQEEIYLRNKIRRQVIPWLSEKINPNLVETLNRTADIIQYDEEILQKETEKLAQKYVLEKENKLSLSLRDWGTLYQGMQRRLIRFAYAQLRESQGLSFLHVEKVQNLAKEGQVGKILQLPGKIIVEKGYNELFFSRARDIADKQEKGIAKQVLKIPGVTVIPETGQSLLAEIVCFEGKPLSENNKIYIPWEEPYPRYYVRSRRAGDRFSPLGLPGTKKLKDFFIEKKIPRQIRDRLLLVVAGEEIVWIPGLALTKHLRRESKSGQYLVLTLLTPSQNI